MVVSDKMAKTIIVSVDHKRVRPPYQKAVKVSRRYKVHDEQNQYHIGDQVDFEECRPLSRDKRWRVVDHENTKSQNQ